MSTNARPYRDADYLALKAATRRATEAAGPLSSIAARTRSDPAMLSRYGNKDVAAFVPIDIAMDLDALAGDPLILRAWAERCGFDLVAIEREKRTNNLADHISDVAHETADVLGALADVAKKPALTPNDAMRVERETAEAISALERLREDARSAVTGEAPAADNVRRLGSGS